VTDEFAQTTGIESMNRPGRVGRSLQDHSRAIVASGVHRYNGLQPDWTGAADTVWASARQQVGHAVARVAAWLRPSDG
jgi:hypothetical protein